MVRAAESELSSGELLPAEKDFGVKAFTRCETREDPSEREHDITVISDDPKAWCDSAELCPQGLSASALAALLEFLSSGSALAALLEFLSSALPS